MLLLSLIFSGYPSAVRDKTELKIDGQTRNDTSSPSQGATLLVIACDLLAFSANQQQQSVFEVTPLQPEAESCLSHSPQSVRLSGS